MKLLNSKDIKEKEYYTRDSYKKNTNIKIKETLYCIEISGENLTFITDNNFTTKLIITHDDFNSFQKNAINQKKVPFCYPKEYIDYKTQYEFKNLNINKKKNMEDLTNYIITYCAKICKDENEEKITNFMLQKITYFTFIYSIQDNKNISLLKEIYTEPFVTYRHGPLLESSFQAYSNYGTIEIDESINSPYNTYEELDMYINKALKEAQENIFKLVNLSQKNDLWINTNNDPEQWKNKKNRYSFKDLYTQKGE